MLSLNIRGSVQLIVRFVVQFGSLQVRLYAPAIFKGGAHSLLLSTWIPFDWM